jgi:hypothetical protein
MDAVAVEGGVVALGVLRVANRLVEIEDHIERCRGSHPFVDLATDVVCAFEQDDLDNAVV